MNIETLLKESVNHETRIITANDVISCLKSFKLIPSLQTVSAVLNHKSVILVGGDLDIYKVVFVMDDYSFFTLELKGEKFSKTRLGKSNKEYILSLCNESLSRFSVCGYLCYDYENNIIDFQNKRISLKDIERILSNSHPTSVPIKEELRHFGLNLIRN